VPASYPTAVKSFTTKNTGNTVQAAHVNDLQEEVAAIETDILTVFASGLAAGSGGPFNWTPALTFATPGDLSVTYSTQSGTGIKAGRWVFLYGAITTATFTHTTASGALIVSGNPHTNGSGVAVGACSWQGVTKANYTNVVSSIGASATNIQFLASGSGQAAATISTGDVPTGGTVQLVFSLLYLTA
jgi:hypothetical protein